MAFCLPAQRDIERYIASLDRRRQLVELDRRFRREDCRTVSTDRGPVRGYPGGAKAL